MCKAARLSGWRGHDRRVEHVHAVIDEVSSQSTEGEGGFDAWLLFLSLSLGIS